ncbi:ABC transporter ATP-binding protein [Microbacterium atlanticum]|uniref:ABC transporter ATP-binding protein n=1 Tax=Microbacterium atlanticum TaxID=2782168 RepID=UPI001E4BC4CF|nr:ABC transporter ATP-binding protein [Microbacterium atlanticum]
MNPERPVVLDLAGLVIRNREGAAIVDGVDLRLHEGEVMVLAGESGSGKTTVALSLLGHCGDGLTITAGSLEIAGTPMRMDDSMRSSRGSVIAYVPQDPKRALNPALRIGDSLRDVARAHGIATGGLAERLLASVGLPSTQAFERRYPHQLSGGQLQRVSIAAALACDPAVIVLDEPTTGLDVVTQAKILDELRRVRDEKGVAMIYVTHDLGVAAEVADRLAVMYAGELVEDGPARDVLARPRHPYTRGLLASIPDHVSPRRLQPLPGVSVAVGERPSGCHFAPRCGQKTQRCETDKPALTLVPAGEAVRCFEWERTPPVENIPLELANRPADTPTARVPVLAVSALSAHHRSAGEKITVARDINFVIERGASVALVGESGSGKTTIARTIAGLHSDASGQILLDGTPMRPAVHQRPVAQRRMVQMVFQNPAEALNPRHTVAQSIGRTLRLLRGMRGKRASDEVARLLDLVRLPQRLAGRYPLELSGGERQRVAIARGLAADPQLLLCDEVTSALDVSVQAAVLQLLNDLRGELGLSLLFITHDLGVVATVADEVLVLRGGSVAEHGSASQVLRDPQHPYTRTLLEAAPSIQATMRHWKDEQIVRALDPTTRASA